MHLNQTVSCGVPRWRKGNFWQSPYLILLTFLWVHVAKQIMWWLGREQAVKYWVKDTGSRRPRGHSLPYSEPLFHNCSEISLSCTLNVFSKLNMILYVNGFLLKDRPSQDGFVVSMIKIIWQINNLHPNHCFQKPKNFKLKWYPNCSVWALPRHTTERLTCTFEFSMLYISQALSPSVSISHPGDIIKDRLQRFSVSLRNF